jgi:hypothetical protein
MNMNRKTHLVDFAICCTLVLVALVGFISYETTGVLRRDIDGLLLLSICFLVGAVFTALAVSILRSEGWFKLFATERKSGAVPEDGLRNLQTETGARNLRERTQ